MRLKCKLCSSYSGIPSLCTLVLAHKVLCLVSCMVLEMCFGHECLCFFRSKNMTSSLKQSVFAILSRWAMLRLMALGTAPGSPPPHLHSWSTMRLHQMKRRSWKLQQGDWAWFSWSSKNTLEINVRILEMSYKVLKCKFKFFNDLLKCLVWILLEKLVKILCIILDIVWPVMFLRIVSYYSKAVS